VIELPARFIERLFTITLEDWIYLLFSAAVVTGVTGFVLVSNPQFDTQYRFVLREGLDGFPDGEVAVDDRS
jgi:hypothetical protein